MSGNSIVFGEEIRILVFLNMHVIWSTAEHNPSPVLQSYLIVSRILFLQALFREFVNEAKR